MPPLPAKYRILLDVCQFILQKSSFFTLMESIANAHPDIYAHYTATEYHLLHTVHYQQFMSTYDTELSQYLTVHHQTTVNKFQSTVQTAIKYDKTGSCSMLVHMLSSITEFELWVELMKSREKRQYLQSMMTTYAQQIQVEATRRSSWFKFGRKSRGSSSKGEVIVHAVNGKAAPARTSVSQSPTNAVG